VTVHSILTVASEVVDARILESRNMESSLSASFSFFNILGWALLDSEILVRTEILEMN
jgi:hypothetical protein